MTAASCVFSQNQGEFYSDVVVVVDKAEFEAAGDSPAVTVESSLQERKFMICRHSQELAQLADLASDWLFILV